MCWLSRVVCACQKINSNSKLVTYKHAHQFDHFIWHSCKHYFFISGKEFTKGFHVNVTCQLDLVHKCRLYINLLASHSSSSQGFRTTCYIYIRVPVSLNQTYLWSFSPLITVSAWATTSSTCPEVSIIIMGKSWIVLPPCSWTVLRCRGGLPPPGSP